MEDKITKSRRLNAIVDAVCYWLGYQYKIGRQGLMHEASLRYPIADTITANGIQIEKIVLEKPHPIFENKYIDLVILDNVVENLETENNGDNLKEIYEFKLAKIQTRYATEQQRIFDDIVRLAYHHLWGDKECYFLMCGEYDDFKTHFVSQKSKITINGGKLQALANQPMTTESIQEWKPEGMYEEWFGFKIGEEKIIEFDDSNPEFGLKPFQINYKVKNPEKHIYNSTFTIKTNCVAITPSAFEGVRTHAAGLWKIEAIKQK